MFKSLLALCLCAVSLAAPAAAQDRVTLGFARLFDNDAIGDGRDRWRSGSYMVSKFSGPSWEGTLPKVPGQLLEYRFRTEVIAPASLTRRNPADRRYAGILSFGVHTHFALGQVETALGLDLVATGPQTGIGAFQRETHDLLGMTEPKVLGTQIPNRVHPTVRAEIGKEFALGRAKLRPFVEAQAGIESFARVGGDLVIGEFGSDALMVRDVVTGHRVEGVGGSQRRGFSVVLGGDVAHMFDSDLLPGGGVEMSDTRSRLRAGMNWQGEKSTVFYGVTWLGKEYETQPDDQIVGSLRLRLRF